jgi:hypothetical protein
MPADALDIVAALTAEVGTCYQRARRYRALAARCEDFYLARALEIGSEVRRAARGGLTDTTALAAAVISLRTLVSECEAEIAQVRGGDAYRRAAAAWADDRWDEVAAAAPAIFAAVEPYDPCPTLYWAISITARRRGDEHFISPAVCAAAILDARREGIRAAAPPPDLGADETVGAIVLTDDPETAESPVLLAIDPADLPPACRVAPAGDALIYARSLRVPFEVRLAESVTDEWWAVRPEAYREYAAGLRAELAASAITVRRGPP